jgi:hypothetical protein
LCAKDYFRGIKENQGIFFSHLYANAVKTTP